MKRITWYRAILGLGCVLGTSVTPQPCRATSFWVP